MTHTQLRKKDNLNQTYIGWADRVNETQVQTVSANESGQRIMGNEVFDGVVEEWDGRSRALQLEIMTPTLTLQFESNTSHIRLLILYLNIKILIIAIKTFCL